MTAAAYTKKKSTKYKEKRESKIEVCVGRPTNRINRRRWDLDTTSSLGTPSLLPRTRAYAFPLPAFIVPNDLIQALNKIIKYPAPEKILLCPCRPLNEQHNFQKDAFLHLFAFKHRLNYHPFVFFLSYRSSVPFARVYH